MNRLAVVLTFAASLGVFAEEPADTVRALSAQLADDDVACILPRLLQCYDTGDTVIGKTGDEALKILHGER